jgi:hypothetical protein
MDFFPTYLSPFLSRPVEVMGQHVRPRVCVRSCMGVSRSYIHFHTPNALGSAVGSEIEM